MAENFDLIFGQNASQQYAWNDADYQNGWETIGNIPPTAAQFDALQRRSDTKLKELNDELTPLVNADTADSRQPSTTYSEGDIKYSSLLPTGWFLTCTTAGTTGSGDIALPSPIAEKDTVTDGAVTWTIRKIGSSGSGGDGVPLGAILPFAGNGAVPAGYLLCDGAAVSRTMYPDLFSVIGTTYGAGDGSTTFNVPDYNTAKRFVQDASRSSAVYGKADTVQPPALTTRYIIKAFGGQTADSALIDITQYANGLAGKANRALDNLTQAGQDSFLERDFTIIYPNGGSEASPANVTANRRYVEPNPFPGYRVNCVAEIKLNNRWCDSGFVFADGGWGVKATHLMPDDNVIVQVGSVGLLASSTDSGNGFNINPAGTVTAAPCRVKVWKIGKIPTA